MKVTIARSGGSTDERKVKVSARGRSVTRLGKVSASPCPRCRGEGKIVESPCEACRGEGRTERRRSLRVTIPAGIDEGLLALSVPGQVG